MADREHYQAQGLPSAQHPLHMLTAHGVQVSTVFTEGLTVEDFAEKVIMLPSSCLASLFSRTAQPVGAFFPL